jgi:hypothetical protein
MLPGFRMERSTIPGKCLDTWKSISVQAVTLLTTWLVQHVTICCLRIDVLVIVRRFLSIALTRRLRIRCTALTSLPAVYACGRLLSAV